MIACRLRLTTPLSVSSAATAYVRLCFGTEGEHGWGRTRLEEHLSMCFLKAPCWHESWRLRIQEEPVLQMEDRSILQARKVIKAGRGDSYEGFFWQAA